jgi:hypothetical protein
MHVGVGQLYCESAIFESMNHRDHIPETVYVERRPAPLQQPPPPIPHHSALFTSAPRSDISSTIIKTPAPALSHFGSTTPGDSNLNPNLNVIIPENREHVSWNEFQAINKGVSRERIQEVWKTTPWFRTPDPNRFAHAAAADRVSWNDFQRILKGKGKEVNSRGCACGRMFPPLFFRLLSIACSSSENFSVFPGDSQSLV